MGKRPKVRGEQPFTMLLTGHILFVRQAKAWAAWPFQRELDSFHISWAAKDTTIHIRIMNHG